MSAWVAPITWVAAQTVTAAQMNANVRDTATWLKAAFTVLTGGTEADTGTTMFVDISRTSSSEPILRGRVAADAQPRVEVTALGQLAFGSGAATVDAKVRRVGANTMRGDNTAIGADRTASTDAALQALVAGDSVARYVVLASGATQLSTGGATADIQTSRFSAGLLLQTTNGTANTATYRLQSEAGQQANLDLMVVGDTVVRTRIKGDATFTGIQFSSGSAATDVSLYRFDADDLRTDVNFGAASYKVAGTTVVGARVTGYSAITGSGNRGTVYDTSTITLAQLAGRVKSMEDDMIAHGLIGT